VAERIRERIEAFQPPDSELEDLHVTASIGMAVSQGASARELIARADQALYQAKQSGKNRVVEWKTPDQNDTGTSRNPR
jgi:diguanylate cyclase (GGDEF)-like protein